MPTPSARPPSDMMFSVVPVWYIRKKVATIEIGMDTPMISVLRRSLRKNSSIENGEETTDQAALPQHLADRGRMKRDWSTPVTTAMPSGSSSPHVAQPAWSAWPPARCWRRLPCRSPARRPPRRRRRVMTSRCLWPRSTTSATSARRHLRTLADDEDRLHDVVEGRGTRCWRGPGSAPRSSYRLPPAWLTFSLHQERLVDLVDVRPSSASLP